MFRRSISTVRLGDSVVSTNSTNCTDGPFKFPKLNLGFFYSCPILPKLNLGFSTAAIEIS